MPSSLRVVRGSFIAGSTTFLIVSSVALQVYAQTPGPVAPTASATPAPAAPPAAAPPAAAPAPAAPAPAKPAPAPEAAPSPGASAPAPSPAVAPAPAAPIAPAPAVEPAPAPAAPSEPAPATSERGNAAASQSAGGSIQLGEASAQSETQTSGSVLAPPPIEDDAASEPEKKESSWYDAIDVGVFVDSYYSLNWQSPKPQNGRNRFRAFDTSNGFAISWVGTDLSYQTDTVGATVSLRFGPSAARFSGASDTAAGLSVAKQAYATWRPGGRDSMLTLDVGKFNSIYGAEVAESNLNFNYTRGMLFWLGQPYFHTGLRATLDVTEQFWITALAVNGWNNSIDNNSGKTFGIQFSAAVPGEGGTPLIDAHLGYLGGPEQVDYGVVTNYCTNGETLDPRNPQDPCNTNVPDASPDRPRDAGQSNTSGLRHFIDLVVGVNPSENLGFLINADLGFENVRQGSLDTVGALPGFASQSWWGVSAAGRYAFNQTWAAALRGEIFGDPDGRATRGDDEYVFNVKDLTLGSGTLTLDYAPTANLLLRLDNRVDVANQDVFRRQVRSYSSTQMTSTLGVVVHTN